MAIEKKLVQKVRQPGSANNWIATNAIVKNESNIYWNAQVSPNGDLLNIGKGEDENIPIYLEDGRFKAGKPYLKTAGSSLRGTLQIDSTTQYERKEIRNDTANPHYGQLGSIIVTDKNNDKIGGFHSYFNNAGEYGIGIYGFNVDNGWYNQLRLGFDVDNNRVVHIPDALPWRKALGLGDPTDGSLPITPAQGGTGHTSLSSSMNALINALTIGNSTSTPQDEDYFISQYVGGGADNTTYRRRPISTLWDYIKSKTDNRYFTLTGRIEIVANTNLDTYRDVGSYYATTSISRTLTNCPITDTAFYMEVGRALSTTYPYQKIHNYLSNVTYYRTTKADGEWNKWYKIASSAENADPNKFLATPTNATGYATYRSITVADLPNIPMSKITDISLENITSGVLPVSRGGTGETTKSGAFNNLATTLTTQDDPLTGNEYLLVTGVGDTSAFHRRRLGVGVLNYLKTQLVPYTTTESLIFQATKAIGNTDNNSDTSYLPGIKIIDTQGTTMGMLNYFFGNGSYGVRLAAPHSNKTAHTLRLGWNSSEEPYVNVSYPQAWRDTLDVYRKSEVYNKNEVYSKTETGNNFLSKSGDTSSGSLTIKDTNFNLMQSYPTTTVTGAGYIIRDQNNIIAGRILPQVGNTSHNSGYRGLRIEGASRITVDGTNQTLLNGLSLTFDDNGQPKITPFWMQNGYFKDANTIKQAWATGLEVVPLIGNSVIQGTISFKEDDDNNFHKMGNSATLTNGLRRSTNRIRFRDADDKGVGGARGWINNSSATNLNWGLELIAVNAVEGVGNALRIGYHYNPDNTSENAPIIELSSPNAWREALVPSETYANNWRNTLVPNSTAATNWRNALNIGSLFSSQDARWNVAPWINESGRTAVGWYIDAYNQTGIRSGIISFNGSGAWTITANDSEGQAKAKLNLTSGGVLSKTIWSDNGLGGTQSTSYYIPRLSSLTSSTTEKIAARTTDSADGLIYVGDNGLVNIRTKKNGERYELVGLPDSVGLYSHGDAPDTSAGYIYKIYPIEKQMHSFYSGTTLTLFATGNNEALYELGAEILDYNYITIYYRDNDARYLSVEVYKPYVNNTNNPTSSNDTINGKLVNLTSINVASNAAMRIRTKQVRFIKRWDTASRTVKYYLKWEGYSGEDELTWESGSLVKNHTKEGTNNYHPFTITGIVGRLL